MLQARAQEYVRWRQELYSIEARLGITRNLDGLRRSLYPDVDYDFTGLNADLAGIARMIIDNELSASTILEHAEALQRVVAICEKYERAAAVPARNSPAGAAWEESFVTSEQFEEINSTITRAKLCLKHVKMTQDVLQSLTAALYNRINKQDTQSMETIAVVTLLFLPATFVSAIFSTGIFRFHAGEADGNGRVISSIMGVTKIFYYLTESCSVALRTGAAAATRTSYYRPEFCSVAAATGAPATTADTANGHFCHNIGR
ncbi:hypothetical protein H2199_008104 [Coniosporium tulheliwenetii]|uniref:Uncharacterized protein n=1 Tax=Coniosporium tulheliwenetii TaxID=3383036 RepID=A0ACC2YM88_9PEZI|nr:hypothetical protein H2199_008104 [Cladosporium sp. JES 115]